jgi:hypothetical protein
MSSIQRSCIIGCGGEFYYLVPSLADCIGKVERAFTLWATDAIVVETFEDSHDSEKKNNVITLKPVHQYSYTLLVCLVQGQTRPKSAKVGKATR